MFVKMSCEREMGFGFLLPFYEVQRFGIYRKEKAKENVKETLLGWRRLLAFGSDLRLTE